MNKPKISVCLITYNHENYISECIEGILNQKTDCSYEIVIGEDKSTDSTFKICREYKLKYPSKIKLLEREQNLGMNRNWELTLNECEGEYIAICEGDDYWIDSYKLQKQVDFLEGNQEYGLVHSDANVLDTKKNKFTQDLNKRKNYSPKAGYVLNEIILINYPIFTCTVCLKKELIQDFINTDRDYGKFVVADTPLWMEVAKNSKIKYMDETFATRRLLPESASQTQDFNKKISILNSTYESRYNFIKKNNCNSELNKKLRIDQNKKLLALGFMAKQKEIVKDSWKFLKKNKIRTNYFQKLFFISFHLTIIRPLVIILYKFSKNN